MANINYVSFPAKFSGGAGAFTNIKLGYKSTFLSENLFLYGDAGAVIKSGNSGKTGADFGFGAGLGYSLPLGQKGFIDITPSINYVIQSVVNRSWLDLHVAYRFKL